jgi:hypothetical protein
VRAQHDQAEHDRDELQTDQRELVTPS